MLFLSSHLRKSILLLVETSEMTWVISCERPLLGIESGDVEGDMIKVCEITGIGRCNNIEIREQTWDLAGNLFKQ